jgi:hypothetical protein
VKNPSVEGLPMRVRTAVRISVRVISSYHPSSS